MKIPRNFYYNLFFSMTQFRYKIELRYKIFKKHFPLSIFLLLDFTYSQNIFNFKFLTTRQNFAVFLQYIQIFILAKFFVFYSVGVLGNGFWLLFCSTLPPPIHTHTLQREDAMLGVKPKFLINSAIQWWCFPYSNRKFTYYQKGSTQCKFFFIYKIRN